MQQSWIKTSLSLSVCLSVCLVSSRLVCSACVLACLFMCMFVCWLFCCVSPHRTPRYSSLWFTSASGRSLLFSTCQSCFRCRPKYTRGEQKHVANQHPREAHVVPNKRALRHREPTCVLLHCNLQKKTLPKFVLVCRNCTVKRCGLSIYVRGQRQRCKLLHRSACSIMDSGSCFPQSPHFYYDSLHLHYCVDFVIP